MVVAPPPTPLLEEDLLHGDGPSPLLEENLLYGDGLSPLT